MEGPTSTTSIASHEVSSTVTAMSDSIAAPPEVPVVGVDEPPAATGETDAKTTRAESIAPTATLEDTRDNTQQAVVPTVQPSEAPATVTSSGNDVMNVDLDAGDAPKQRDVTRDGAAATAVSTETTTDNVEMVDPLEPSTNDSIVSPAQPHVTDALEAMLNGSMDVDDGAANNARSTQPQGQPIPDQPDSSSNITQEQAGGQTAQAAAEAAAEGEGVDWEADSSPYESSSSDSDSSDDSDDEAGSDADMVGVQETVRMLMESAMQDSDDDDEDGGNRGGGAANIRSKNEEAEMAPPKPDVEIGANDEVVLLGPILHIVENSAVIRGNTDGAYRVLDAGSVLCRSDRTVVGVVADVIGNVRSPMYVLRFSQSTDLAKDGLEQGQDLFYPPKHASFVFTEELRNTKGSDASNLHDEEVGTEEAEFSDDEKEAAYKRELKARRRGGGGGGGSAGGSGGNKRAQLNNRGAHPLQNEVSNSGSLQYDDDEDDGLYKPLTRPANFGQGGLPQVSPPSANPGRGVGGGGDGGGNGLSGAAGRGNSGSSRGQPRFNRAAGGGGRGNRGGRYRGRGGGGGGDLRGGRGDWNGGNRNNNSNYAGGGQQNQNQYNFSPSAPPPPPTQAQQQYQPQQTPAAPWPFAGLPAGLPFPPPPPPPAKTGAVSSPAASVAAAAALLNNAQIQQLLQQHQQQHQQQQQYAPPPAWPGMPAQPPQPPFQYQYQQPQQYQPPQQQQQQQQAQQQPTASPAVNAATFQYLFQGSGAQGQPGQYHQQQQ